MGIEDEFKYETTIEDIVFHLEEVIANALLASIKRLSGKYKEITLKVAHEKEDEEQF
ncbi:MAG: hypothetical protein PHN75_18335 [Syntrophales bacterium]|nr:hypothetical protein [Syntrophales bacterium]